jgi:hypothetical protein
MTASYIVWRNFFSLFYLILDFLIPTEVTQSYGNIPIIIQIAWQVELSIKLLILAEKKNNET